MCNKLAVDAVKLLCCGTSICEPCECPRSCTLKRLRTDPFRRLPRDPGNVLSLHALANFPRGVLARQKVTQHSQSVRQNRREEARQAGGACRGNSSSRANTCIGGVRDSSTCRRSRLSAGCLYTSRSRACGVNPSGQSARCVSKRGTTSMWH